MVYSCMMSSHGKMSLNFTCSQLVKSFSDKIEINGLDKAFVKSF